MAARRDEKRLARRPSERETARRRGARRGAKASLVTSPAQARSHSAAPLSPGFVEFGRSGRRYTREEIIAADIGDFSAVLPLRDLAMRPLGDDYVLVTYQSEISGLRANRSSIWRRTSDGWLMEFHQGTPTDHP